MYQAIKSTTNKLNLNFVLSLSQYISEPVSLRVTSQLKIYKMLVGLQKPGGGEVVWLVAVPLKFLTPRKLHWQHYSCLL